MPQKVQARIDPRVSAELHVDLQYPWGSGDWSRARSLDLSTSGIYVETDIDLPLKAQLGCRVHLPGVGGESETMLQAQAIVVRVNGPEPGKQEWRYGLYFVELTESDAEALRRFIFSRV